MANRINNLTPKQKHFCRTVASGCTMSDAYREAYNTSNMKPASIQEEAWRLSQHPDVSLKIREAREAVSLTAEYLASEAIENMHEARYLGQIAASNGAVPLAARLTGNLDVQEQASDVRITKVTVILSAKATDTDADELVVDVEDYEVR